LKCSRPRQPGTGREAARTGRARCGLAKLAAGSGLRLIPDTAAASGFFGKWLAYFGTTSRRAARRRLHRRSTSVPRLIGGMIRGASRSHLRRHFLQDNAPLAQQLAGPTPRRWPVRSGQRRSVTWASARCSSVACGRWCRSAARSPRASAAASRPRGRRDARRLAHRAGPADEGDPGRARAFTIRSSCLPADLDNIGISLVMT